MAATNDFSPAEAREQLAGSAFPGSRQPHPKPTEAREGMSNDEIDASWDCYLRHQGRED